MLHSSPPEILARLLVLELEREDASRLAGSIRYAASNSRFMTRMNPTCFQTEAVSAISALMRASCACASGYPGSAATACSAYDLAESQRLKLSSMIDIQVSAATSFGLADSCAAASARARFQWSASIRFLMAWPGWASASARIAPKKSVQVQAAAAVNQPPGQRKRDTPPIMRFQSGFDKCCGLNRSARHGSDWLRVSYFDLGQSSNLFLRHSPATLTLANQYTQLATAPPQDWAET